MDMEKMRHCMSLGYSAKRKMVDTIGQCKFSLFVTLFLITSTHTHSITCTPCLYSNIPTTPSDIFTHASLDSCTTTLKHVPIVPLYLPFELYVSDGNGFKTSTMRLGADVIVFSRCRGKNGRRFALFIKYRVAFEI